jgi:hypothetical protein
MFVEFSKNLVASIVTVQAVVLKKEAESASEI